jgi:hypothetical protein
MITICVYHQSNGKPAAHEKVHLSFGGDWTGSFLNEYTDSNGEAHFNTEPRTGKVIVGGSERFSGYLSGKVVVYI